MAKCQVNKNRRRKAARKMTKYRRMRQLQKAGLIMSQYIRDEFNRRSFVRQLMTVEERVYSELFDLPYSIQ